MSASLGEWADDWDDNDDAPAVPHKGRMSPDLTAPADDAGSAGYPLEAIGADPLDTVSTEPQLTDGSLILVPSNPGQRLSTSQGADDIEADKLFEIVDHTNATPWESFIASIEDLLHIWCLTEDHDKPKSHCRRPTAPGHTFELLSYSGVSYTLTYLFNRSREPTAADQPYLDVDEIPPLLQRQLGSLSSDFMQDGMYIHIQRWFGLGDFLLLAPSGETPVDMSHAKLLLSSLSIAFNNTRCPLPAFVQVGEAWRNHYIGYSLADGVQVRFDTSMLNFIPRNHAHLTGLSDLFASKLNYGASLTRSSLRIRCAARFSFSISNWYNQDWRAAVFRPPGLDVLFWGPRTDPLESLQLGALWPDFAEDQLTDNSAYSELEASKAPVWLLSRHVRPRVSHPMSDLLDVFLSVAANALEVSLESQPPSPQVGNEDLMLSSTSNGQATTATEIQWEGLGQTGLLPGERDDFAGHPPTSLLASLRGNTRVSDMIGAALNGTMGRTSQEGLPTEDEIDEMCILLFAPREQVKLRECYDDVHLRLGRASPRGSLTWFICLQVILNLADPSLQRLAVIWNKFVHEIRTHWEKGNMLIRVDTEAPDQRCCLLHQKLQLLNYCIKRKREADQFLFKQSQRSEHSRRPSTPRRQDKRHPGQNKNRSYSSISPGHSSSVIEEGEDGSFFNPPHDADDLPINLASNGTVETHNDLFTTSSHMSLSMVESKLSREGASRPLAGVFLRRHPDELVYVPMTQDLGYMTEDMLELQQQQLEEMGTTAEATLARAKLQTSSLLSDMEAFKAANPGAELEDFVQWHSPNDWVVNSEGPEKNGHLSTRMTEPDNLWRTTWEASQPVPAHKQKPLFNYEQEANKILHYLENISFADLLQQIFPSAFLIAHESFSMQRYLFEQCDPLKQHLHEIETRLKAVDWNDVAPNLFELHKVTQLIRRLEILGGTAMSLFHKLGVDQRDLVSRLLLSRECDLQTDAERNAVDVLFIERGGPQIFADAPVREYVLRAVSAQPSPGSRTLLHRMYARISDQEFRLVEAYSHDTLFY